MNTKTILGVILLVIIVGAVYMGTRKQTPSAQLLNQPSSKTNTNAIQANTIDIKDFAFSPDTITVKQGTKVTWVNNDSATHTIKSDTFNSSDIVQGGIFEFTFVNKGSFNYVCGIHPSMKGKVIVE